MDESAPCSPGAVCQPVLEARRGPGLTNYDHCYSPPTPVPPHTTIQVFSRQNALWQTGAHATFAASGTDGIDHAVATTHGVIHSGHQGPRGLPPAGTQSSVSHPCSQGQCTAWPGTQWSLRHQMRE